MITPVNVQEPAAMRRRFNAALMRIWTPPTLEEPPETDRPTRHSEHAFDFADGVRLTVFRERRHDQLLMHVITSFWSNLTDEMRLSARSAMQVAEDAGATSEHGIASWLYLLTYRLLEHIAEFEQFFQLDQASVYQHGMTVEQFLRRDRSMPYEPGSGFEGHHIFYLGKTDNIPEHLHG